MLHKLGKQRKGVGRLGGPQRSLDVNCRHRNTHHPNESALSNTEQSIAGEPELEPTSTLDQKGCLREGFQILSLHSKRPCDTLHLDMPWTGGVDVRGLTQRDDPLAARVQLSEAVEFAVDQPLLPDC